MSNEAARTVERPPRKVSPRGRAREWALQALYQIDLAGADPADALAAALQSDEEPLSPEATAFASELVSGIARDLAEIDALIERQSLHWRIERMARVDRNILRLAVHELLKHDTPRKVVLNEAIELAKKFGTEESGAFVNGLLDKLARKIAPEPSV